jgi:Copper transport outer membrane protein, MctB
VIDFRYHLVSIVAVFLALAIGIVVGATALKGSTLKVLDKTSQQEKHQISSLLANNGNLRQQISNDQAFAEAGASPLVGHLLTGQRAVIVTAPGADGQVVSGITTTLQQAGAQVTGQVAMEQQFFVAGQSTQSNLDYLAQQLVPPGINLGQSPQPDANPQIAGQQEAAQVIAAALVTKDGPGLADAQSKAILNGFAQHGYLQVSGTNGAGLRLATLAVVVVPASPPTAGDSDSANLALLALAQQLNATGQAAVLAGAPPGSGPGSAIEEMISGGSGVQLSSVDIANVKTGQIMVAQALSRLLAGHKPASYGIAPGAVPSPAPTPLTTPSATPATTTTKAKTAKHMGRR